MGYRDAMIHGETNVGLGMVGGDSEEDRLIEENRDLRTRLEQAERERDESRQQAETWAQEARTQRETVREIYQLCTGATGEPGDWNGAEPVRAIIRQRDEARGLLREWLLWSRDHFIRGTAGMEDRTDAHLRDTGD